MRIDLHIHTNLSDGSLSPNEIIDEASKNSVNIIAIADHDTIEAYNDELYVYAKSKNVKIINAVEISTKIDKATVHILGYNFDIDNQMLKQKLFLLRNARRDYLYKVADKLKLLGYVLNVDELEKMEVITKAHIARDVINNSSNRDILLKNFNYIPSMGEFIEKIMNEGCPAYVKKETLTPKEAAELIRMAGGKVVLAHPVAYIYEDNFSEDDIVKLINEIEADGIEANYIYVNKENKKINEVDKWNNFAKKYNLISTIGSDFHNKDGIRPEIGLINENITLQDSRIIEIINSI